MILRFICTRFLPIVKVGCSVSWCEQSAMKKQRDNAEECKQPTLHRAATKICPGICTLAARVLILKPAMTSQQ